MAAPLIQTSFTVGEVSPYLMGRVDLTKYKIGAAKMSNFMVDYKGGASKRPGTKFVGKAGYNLAPLILVPFQFNEAQTYVLEIGHFYLRVITNGGYVLNASGNIFQIGAPWSNTDLKKVKYTQSADTMTFVHQSYPIYELIRRGHADWEFRGFSVGANVIPPNFIGLTATTTGFVDAAAAAYTNYSYGVTTVGEDGSESMMSPIGRLINVLDMSAHKVVIQVVWNQVAGRQFYNVWKATTGFQTQMPAGTRLGFIGSTLAEYFVDNNILPSFVRSPPQHNNPFAPGAIKEVIMSVHGSGYDENTAYVAISDPTGFGADIRAQIRDGACVGGLVVNGGQSYTNPTLTFNTAQTSAGTAVLGEASGTYPGAVTYHQQRLLFAGSTNHPSTLWGSQPGAFHNYDSGIPVTDGDAFEFTLASQQLSTIKYMISMPGGLVVLTSGGAWQLSGTQQFAPITPTQVMATPQAFHGCGDLTPITVGYEILFIQAAGSIVRNLSYNFFANIYTSADVTVLSSHLFSGHKIDAWSYAEEPDKTIWLVRDDGKLLSFAFLKEQEVAGWAIHSTQGQYRAVASVREGLRDVTYFAVDRWNPTHGFYTSIERLASRSTGTSVEDAWYLDCALSLPPSYIGGTTLGSEPVQKRMVFYSLADLFTSAWIGSILRVGGGKYRIVGVNDARHIVADEIYPLKEMFYNEEGGFFQLTPQLPGLWDVTWEVANVSGLSHLEGQTVSVLADGQVQADKVVSDGKISIDPPASRVIVGLNYVGDLQTLRLESQPTVQGRMKKIPAMTIRVADTRGLWAGMTEGTVTELKERDPALVPGVATPLITGDLRIVLDPLWREDGQIWIKAPYPLPANVVAVIPEVVLGDG